MPLNGAWDELPPFGDVLQALTLPVGSWHLTIQPFNDLTIQRVTDSPPRQRFNTMPIKHSNFPMRVWNRHFARPESLQDGLVDFSPGGTVVRNFDPGLC